MAESNTEPRETGFTAQALGACTAPDETSRLRSLAGARHDLEQPRRTALLWRLAAYAERGGVRDSASWNEQDFKNPGGEGVQIEKDQMVEDPNNPGQMKKRRGPEGDVRT